MCKITLLLSRLFSQYMTFERVLPFNLTGTCKFKALFSAGVGFYFWH